MQVAKQKIADLLERTIGLHVTSFSNATFQRALETRMQALGLDDFTAYLHQVSVSFEELRMLVEEVVVPETWFFRDQKPFIFLTNYISKAQKKQPGVIFRLLSLPCSTGEEPYSIAMTLMEAGLEPSDYSIDAIDVSEHALAFARKGSYYNNSFRTSDLSFRKKYFHKRGEKFVIKETVREKLNFFQGNILHPGFLESLGCYDVVFCRNVLIYFNNDTQKRTIESLFNLLRPEGLLFTGHSEASLFIGTRFQPVSHSMAFSFYKKRVTQSETGQEESCNCNIDTERSATSSPSPIPDHQPPSQPVKPSPPLAPSPKNDEFDSVQQLADKGKLEEAAKRCENYLQIHNHSAKWYCLLGIIRDNQGKQKDAMELLRKAVYLAPDHVESLIQLSLLTERAGDLERAANYKKRAKRHQEEGKEQ